MRLAPPYSQFVAAYDGMVGIEFFRRVRPAFERLVHHHGIRFCSAADIGCGTGLFACYLNRCWGVPVLAVDKSPAMLRAARRRCGCPGVRFVQQDVRRLCLPEPVDLATANFDTLNHLVTVDDLRLAVRRIADNLRPGGHFYFDIVTTCRPLSGLRGYRRSHGTLQHWLEQSVHWEPARRLIRISVAHHSRGGGAPVVESFCERAYRSDEVGRALMAAGFTIRGVYDEATLQVPRSCPPRLIVVARKPGTHCAR